MDRRFLTVLGVSLVFALVVSSIFYQLTAKASSGGPKTGGNSELRDLVVAARPLPVGVTIKAADLKVEKFPADRFPKAGFSKPEEVLDRPVVSNILVDEPVLEGRLAVRGSGAGLAPVIPVGMRAVTVRVTDVVGVAGFVLPGLRVDVLVTGRPPAGNDTITTTVLQNMLVLSAGQTMQSDQRGAAINAQNVTLLATPEQSETLTLAGNEGRLQLVLRNSSDQEEHQTPGRQLTELYGRTKAKPFTNAAANTGDVFASARPAAPRRIRPVAPPVTVAAPVITPVAMPVAPPIPAPLPEVVSIRGTTKSVETVQNKTN
jgi:pilus assembly protein CpaB